MQRRDFLKLSAMAAAGSHMQMQAQSQAQRPNIILFIADQRTFGLSKATGYPLDTNPTLDRLQQQGIGFERNYCTMPLCVPSRISMLTGRWGNAHRVRNNLMTSEAYFDKDIYQVAHDQGYTTALCGKNHTYLRKDHVDFWREYTHTGGPHTNNAQHAAFDQYLQDTHYNVMDKPTPFPVEAQLPYRIVSDAIEFIDNAGQQPFFVQVSVPEPHNPEQVPAPYWNMFPPESIPERCAGPDKLKDTSFRMQWEYRMQQDASPQTEPLWRRYLSNYMGMLRLIDDQIQRLLNHIDTRGLRDNTLFLFTSDHGDALMNFGLGHKGADLRETVTHTPLIFSGHGVRHSDKVQQSFTSMADIMPTLCEVMGADIPHGVQGRSLWPLLQGEPYPADEFRSIYSSVGLGGLYYTQEDNVPYNIAEDPKGAAFDELNKVTLSGNQKMVRMGDWKLVFDMMGYGQLYNLKNDPCELHNLFNQPAHAKEQASLMAELMMWVMRTEDSLPTGPQNRKYQTKWSTKHNWYAPYRKSGPPPAAYQP
ncbi:sulfatase [Terriglobus roseus]|uniref:Arylsulfatase A n=1 Tax=Terriglobus roseus TaxID=392734 RepID=A0A1G7MNZ4_9BACT|nr:sulfatase-like hydrolase/transferase [Terriglobus roseus]SDF62840.1 Arylsulfatase A [Terriglobus roseus]